MNQLQILVGYVYHSRQKARDMIDHIGGVRVFAVSEVAWAWPSRHLFLILHAAAQLPPLGMHFSNLPAWYVSSCVQHIHQLVREVRVGQERRGLKQLEDLQLLLELQTGSGRH